MEFFLSHFKIINKFNCNMKSSSDQICEPYQNHLMAIKSAAVYAKWWDRYSKYANGRNVEVTEVTTLLNWLCSMKQSNEYAPTTIISAASCVNSKMKIIYQINFMEHMLVKDMIKKLQKISSPKQSAVFSMEQIESFVLNAPETLDYKIKKLIAMVAIQGALRISELCNLQVSDLTFPNDGSLSIRINYSKTDQSGKGHSFIITPNCNVRLCLVKRMKDYLELFETRTGRLFRSATKSNKLCKLPIGVNTMGVIPREIAKFHNLPNIQEYSGHSFRRTSATVLSEKGIGLLELKQHGRWKSSTVAERYVENTVAKMRKTSDMIQNIDVNQKSNPGDESIFVNCSFNDCHINIVHNN